MSLAPTFVAGRYALDEPIGAGGYCEVWRATDTVLTRPVAVKLLHVGYAKQAEALARFKAEARHAGALSHENIARVYDYCESSDGQSYLVMELVEGPSLADVLAGGPLSARRTMDIAAQVAAGLQAAHAAGLIHRDIKPANILFAPDGAVRITDFGIAHAVGSAPLTSTGMVMGTPGYIAPERVGGAQAGPASDLYALGIVAYECLAGSRPFCGGALEVAIAHRDRPLPPLPASVPPEVIAFVMMLTAKDPAWRPGSAAEVAHQAARLRDDLAAERDRAWAAGPAQTVSDVLADPLAVPVDPLAVPPDPLAAVPYRSRSGGPRYGRTVVIAALALAALTCLVLISVTGFASGSHRPDPPSPAGSRAAAKPMAPPTSPPTSPSASRPVNQPSSPSSPSPVQSNADTAGSLRHRTVARRAVCPAQAGRPAEIPELTAATLGLGSAGRSGLVCPRPVLPVGVPLIRVRRRRMWCWCGAGHLPAGTGPPGRSPSRPAGWWIPL
jgi:eukaryotic-like serine/threonine-protein kinase